MSYGRAEKPCAAYRPWKGQEPLCGNCAWTENEHEKPAMSKGEGPSAREWMQAPERRTALLRLITPNGDVSEMVYRLLDSFLVSHSQPAPLAGVLFCECGRQHLLDANEPDRYFGKFARDGEAGSTMNLRAWYGTACYWRKRAEVAEL